MEAHTDTDRGRPVTSPWPRFRALVAQRLPQPAEALVFTEQKEVFSMQRFTFLFIAALIVFWLRTALAGCK